MERRVERQEGRKPRRAPETRGVEDGQRHTVGDSRLPRMGGWLGDSGGRKESCWEGEQVRGAQGPPPVGPTPTLHLPALGSSPFEVLTWGSGQK